MSSPSNKPSPKPSGTDSVSKKQSFQEWAMAGGGVPLQYKGREHVWDRKVKQYAEGGEVGKGGAAFGVFPQMKPRRSKQDREAAKNVPVDLARGFVSGVLGAPGDIESLARLPYELITGKDSPTFLPTSEDIEKRLPFRSEAPVSRAASGAGQLAGGFYMGPGSPLRAVGALPGAIKHGAQEFAKASAGAAPRVIKPKGGNWFGNRAEKELNTLKKNKMAGENLEEMKRVYPPDVLATMSPETRVSIDRAFPHLEKEAALNNWIDRNLTNYVKKEMATPDDPVRKLAEQNITHYPVAEDPGYWSRHGRTAREDFGGTEMANSPLAKQWENRTDAMIMQDTAQQHQDMMHLAPGMYSDKDEWIKKLAPNTPLYSVQQNRFSTLDLGFDHIMDVLREDLAAGRIRPEQLSKVSMTDAVRRTHQYDQELAKKMAEAKATAREGLPVHKEYPEGYKWVELNKPGSFASESDAMGHSVRGYEPPKGHPDWTELSGDSGSSGYGHGGWEAIKSGKAKVYSLVDPKGASHATVEVGPTHRDRGFFGNQRPIGDDYYSQQNKYIAGQNDGTVSPQLTFAEWWRASQGIPEPEPLAPRISQIKGKGNRAPKEDYLPFVQDFVRGGKWSGVGDFKNTGLIRKSDLIDRFGPDDLDAIGKGEYLTKGEYDDLLLKALKPEGMKAGGPVKMAGGGAIKEALKKLLNPKAPTSTANGLPAGAGIKSVDELAAKYPNVKLNASVNKNDINLSRIVVPKEMRNQGIGTQVMNDLSEYADNTGKRITLTPSSDFGGNVSKLKGFYKDLGFVENKGRNKDFSIMETMYREPKPLSQTPDERSLLPQNAQPPEIGEVKMAGGGKMMGNLLKNLVKKEKVDHPLVFPRAEPKGKEDIRPIAQRMAEQMTGDFVRQNPKVTTNVAGKSRKQFEREKSIPLVTRNVVPESAVPPIDYEKFKDYAMVGVPGDPSLGGVAKRGSLTENTKPTVELTQVGDITPDQPVPLFGGPRFGNDEVFWASNADAAAPVQSNVNALSELYDAPVLGKYIKMASDSANFALHNLDSLLAIQRPERLNPGKMEQLNDLIRKGSPKYGEFPGFKGFDDPADVLLQSQLNSKLRKHIAETLTKPTITDAFGLPNGLDVVAAITHPQLRNLETGVSGFSVGQMTPGATLRRGESAHPTYDTNIPGQLIGQNKYPTPYEIAFPDTTAYARSQLKPGVQEFNMMKLLGPREKVDQQYIDEMKMYEELMKQYTGRKKGGAVSGLSAATKSCGCHD